MLRFSRDKLFQGLIFFVFFNTSILPLNASSALAAWSLKSNGVLELRTKSNTTLKAFFQRGTNSYGDRFWIDFDSILTSIEAVFGSIVC